MHLEEVLQATSHRSGWARFGCGELIDGEYDSLFHSLSGQANPSLQWNNLC